MRRIEPDRITDNPIRLSVIIPTYNEAARIGDSLERIVSYFQDCGERFEILVVDDGSTDETARVVERLAERMKRVRLLKGNANRGKGYAVRWGMMTAHGDYVLMTDADFSTPIQEIVKLLPALETEGYDVAIGSRALPESNVRVRQSILRENMGKCFNLLVRLFAVGGFRDTQCGFKCFTSKAARLIFVRQSVQGFCFDVEVLVIAHALGLRVKEAPVVWVNSPGSSVHIIHAPIRMFVDLVRIAMRKWRGDYRARPGQD